MNAGSSVPRKRFIWLGALAVVAGVGGFGFHERDRLLALYGARRLATASEADQAAWVDWLAGRPAAVEPLLGYLHRRDVQRCENCGHALAELVRRWGPLAPATRYLAQTVVAQFPSLPPLGKEQALWIAAAALTPIQEEQPVQDLAIVLARLLQQDALVTSEELRPAALLLAIRLANELRPPSDALVKTCQGLVAAGLTDTRAQCRVDAVRLAAAPGVELLHKLPPLLTGPTPDPSPEVRRTALVLLGQREGLTPTEDLLPILHDSCAEVRVLCEKTLRSRGLTAEQIELARWMTDPQATVRARVPAKVLECPDLDTHVWLDRLSRDPSPAVRAAVVRTAASAMDARVHDRIREMAGNDPSPTVRELADYYLRHARDRSR